MAPTAIVQKNCRILVEKPEMRKTAEKRWKWEADVKMNLKKAAFVIWTGVFRFAT